MSDSGGVAPCPHPECAHAVRVPDRLPGGDYLCPCHAITLSLGWYTAPDGERRPLLRRLEKPAG